MVKCCLCGKDAGRYGNNAIPVKKGQCCDSCNKKYVIPERVNRSMEMLRVKKK